MQEKRRLGWGQGTDQVMSSPATGTFSVNIGQLIDGCLSVFYVCTVASEIPVSEAAIEFNV